MHKTLMSQAELGTWHSNIFLCCEIGCVISSMVCLQFPLKVRACRGFPMGQLFQYFILTGGSRIMCPTLSNVEPKLQANTSAPSHFS